MPETVDLSKLRDSIVESFKDNIGQQWEKMTTEDVGLLKTLAEDAASLHLKNLLSDDKKLVAELRVVNASLLNMTVAKYLPIQKVFWSSLERAATLTLSVLIKAALAAI